MKQGVGNHCDLFLCASATCDWIKMHGYVFLGIMCLTAYARAQQFGPIPARPQQFPGATLIQPAKPNFRQRPGNSRVISDSVLAVDRAQATQLRRPQPIRKAKVQPIQAQIVDQQRTNLIDDVSAPYNNKIAAPTPLPQFQTQTTKLTPRPVEEEVNEDEEIPTTIVTTPSTTAYTVPVRTNYSPPPAPVPAPAPLLPNQSPSGFQRPQFVQPHPLRPGLPQQVPPLQFVGPALQGRQLIRQQQRPVQGVQPTASRQQLPQALPPQIQINPQQVSEEDLYFRQVQSRPLKKQEPSRQQAIEREPIRQPPVRQDEAFRQPPARAHIDYPREPHVKAPQRERKPVAQTIRKYHEEHEDGSITWGYENDDGSFKEETIGVDCVTRGKYGYFDPDGVKREYTYQTGIPCDKAHESEEAASNQGFIDYTNNKYVLPNGDEIDLEAMVKNRARKPVSRYTNRS